MSKNFEELLIDIQSDMVSICMEYVNEMADKIYIYCSNEDGVISSQCFFMKNNIFYKKHQVNSLLDQGSSNVSVERQRALINIIDEDIEKVENLCNEYGVEVPAEMKIVYSLVDNDMKSEMKYGLVYSGDLNKTADDIADEWFDEVKKSI